MTIHFQILDLTERDCLNRVGWFFRHEEERIGWHPMLFDYDRWGQCGEAIIAEQDGQIIGIVTLAPMGLGDSKRPTIDTLYVPDLHCRKGVGSALFERGLRRLLEKDNNQRVFCQLSSSLMLKVVGKLPQDLRDRLEVLEAFQGGDLAMDFVPREKRLTE
jgi:GNAT superfamily N-acetyltransferase